MTVAFCRTMIHYWIGIGKDNFSSSSFLLPFEELPPLLFETARLDAEVVVDKTNLKPLKGNNEQEEVEALEQNLGTEKPSLSCMQRLMSRRGYTRGLASGK